MIQIKGQYELADFRKAQALHARRSGLATWSYLVFGLVALAAVGTIIEVIMGNMPTSSIIAAVIPVGLFLALLFVAAPYQLARVFAQQKELTAPFEMELTDQEFGMCNALGASHLPWNTFVKWKESREMLLLYSSDMAFRMLPKRLLRDDEVGYIVDRLRQNGVPVAEKVRNPVQTMIVAGLIIVGLIVLVVAYYWVRP